MGPDMLLREYSDEKTVSTVKLSLREHSFHLEYTSLLTLFLIVDFGVKRIAR